jgi:hypothetical protein
VATQDCTIDVLPAQPRARIDQTIETLMDLVDRHFPEWPEQSHQQKRDLLNEQIAGLDHGGRIAGAFSLTVAVAAAAIEAVGELQEFPGADEAELADILSFWYTVRDHALVAALDCRGGNNSFTEALVTRRLLQKCGGTL